LSLSSLAGNYRILKRLAQGADLLPVVKADAYGHGIVPVSKKLVQCGARRLAVAYVREGVVLRRAGIRAKILVITPTLPAEIPLALSRGLTLQVSTLEGAQAIARVARRLGRQGIPVHVKIDTGMGRVGFRPDQSLSDLTALFRIPEIRVESLYTHLATADWTNPDYAKKQSFLFRRVLEATGMEVCHIANSAALLTSFPLARGSWARPGLALYGVYPNPRMKRLARLKPVMQLKCRVIHVKTIAKGQSVSYNRTFIAKRTTQVATLGIGYADGLLRSLSNKGHCLLHGKKAPLIGNVCMDMSLVDATGIRGLKAGDVATLWGTEGSAVLGVEEQADAAGTIAYELLCAVGDRVQRIYKR